MKASALWGLVDEKSRKAVFPERYGIEIAGVETGKEIDLPGPIRKLACDREKRFEVPYSFVDLNGHMNNTRYFDLAEDCVGAAAGGKLLKEIRTEYVNEARWRRAHRCAGTEKTERSSSPARAASRYSG